MIHVQVQGRQMFAFVIINIYCPNGIPRDHLQQADKAQILIAYREKLVAFFFLSPFDCSIQLRCADHCA